MTWGVNRSGGFDKTVDVKNESLEDSVDEFTDDEVCRLLLIPFAMSRVLKKPRLAVPADRIVTLGLGHEHFGAPYQRLLWHGIPKKQMK